MITNDARPVASGQAQNVKRVADGEHSTLEMGKINRGVGSRILSTNG
jgi:hypothetical protein